MEEVVQFSCPRACYLKLEELRAPLINIVRKGKYEKSGASFYGNDRDTNNARRYQYSTGVGRVGLETHMWQ